MVSSDSQFKSDYILKYMWIICSSYHALSHFTIHSSPIWHCQKLRV